MIAFLRNLLCLLARDGLTVEDVVRMIGPVTHDPGIPLPMSLRPFVSGVATASLGRYPDSGLPYLLVLDFEPTARPAVADLVAAFGPYRRGASDRGMPIPLFFEPASGGSAWTVALIADLPPGTVAFDKARVQSVALRRDPIPCPTRSGAEVWR
jgi:hypothetical protein